MKSKAKKVVLAFGIASGVGGLNPAISTGSLVQEADAARRQAPKARYTKFRARQNSCGSYGCGSYRHQRRVYHGCGGTVRRFPVRVACGALPGRNRQTRVIGCGYVAPRRTISACGAITPRRLSGCGYVAPRQRYTGCGAITPRRTTRRYAGCGGVRAGACGATVPRRRRVSGCGYTAPRQARYTGCGAIPARRQVRSACGGSLRAYAGCGWTRPTRRYAGC